MASPRTAKARPSRSIIAPSGRCSIGRLASACAPVEPFAVEHASISARLGRHPRRSQRAGTPPPRRAGIRSTADGRPPARSARRERTARCSPRPTPSRRRPLNAQTQAIHCLEAQRRRPSVRSSRWNRPPRLPISAPRAGVAQARQTDRRGFAAAAPAHRSAEDRQGREARGRRSGVSALAARCRCPRRPLGARLGRDVDAVDVVAEIDDAVPVRPAGQIDPDHRHGLGELDVVARAVLHLASSAALFQAPTGPPACPAAAIRRDRRRPARARSRG